MYFSDNMGKITISMYEPMIDMLLHSLELYAYNLHFINKNYCEDYELQNIFLKYAYEDILKAYNSQKYQQGYNCLSNCQSVIDTMKKKNYYQIKKYNKKIA